MRLEIQLLRSLAVLSVIFFHFEKELFSNGYLGVDVFFVISGYLIFNKIREQIENQSFKLKNFYYKRFKRLFPSLLSSATFTLVLGLYNLSLEHLYELIRGLKYSIFFVGNIYFSQLLNYFSVETDRNLIINLWSLSVEEQFYIIFPIFVIFIYKFKKPFPKLLLSVALVISLLASTTQFYNAFSMSKIFFSFDNFIFYSPFTRGWQLLIGVLVPFKLKKTKHQNQISKILITVLFLLLFTNFKLYNQFLASIITAILLTLRPNFKETVSIKIFKHIGDISYSLYLFHQPVLAAIRNHYFYKGNPVQGLFSSNLSIGLVLLLSIYLISITNYIYVEKNFLTQLRLPTLNKIFLLNISIFLLIVFFRPITFTSIFAQSLNSVEYISSAFKSKPGTNYLLSNEDGQLCIDKDNLENACKFGSGKNKLYFLGDSIISSLVSGFLQDEILNQYTIIEFTRAGCYPIYKDCNFIKNSEYEKSIESITDSVIIFGGRDASKIEKIEFSSTIKKLISQGNQIIFIGYIPFPEIDETMYFKKNKVYKNSGNKLFYEKKADDYETFLNSVNSLEMALIENRILRPIEFNNFIYIDIFSTFCPIDYCYFVLNNESFFVDGSHFSYYGSKYLIENSILKNTLLSLNNFNN